MAFTREHVEAIRDLIVDIYGSWSANEVVKVLQALQVGGRRKDQLALVREILGKSTARPGRPPNTQLELIGSKNGSEIGSQTLAKLVPEGAAATGSGYANSLPHTPSKSKSLTSSLRSSGLLGHFVPSKSKDARENNGELVPAIGWHRELADAFAPLRTLQLCELNAKQRVILGRVHALLFANYRIAESGNNAAGIRFAASFARMGRIVRFADVTCQEYLIYGQRYLELRDGKPFHNPFDVEAAVEYQ